MHQASAPNYRVSTSSSLNISLLYSTNELVHLAASDPDTRHRLRFANQSILSLVPRIPLRYMVMSSLVLCSRLLLKYILSIPLIVIISIIHPSWISLYRLPLFSLLYIYSTSNLDVHWLLTQQCWFLLPPFWFHAVRGLTILIKLCFAFAVC